LVRQFPERLSVPPNKRPAAATAQHPRGLPDEIMYAVDTFVPIIDFGEADRWVAHGSLMRGSRWAVILLGWALSSIVVAGFTKLVRTV
jgi:hypothetical protein